VAIELILIVAGYGLLGFYALQQQQQLGESCRAIVERKLV
jgi:hypothetical protein